MPRTAEEVEEPVERALVAENQVIGLQDELDRADQRARQYRRERDDISFELEDAQRRITDLERQVSDAEMDRDRYRREADDLRHSGGDRYGW